MDREQYLQQLVPGLKDLIQSGTDFYIQCKNIEHRDNVIRRLSNDYYDLYCSNKAYPEELYLRVSKYTFFAIQVPTHSGAIIYSLDDELKNISQVSVVSDEWRMPKFDTRW